MDEIFKDVKGYEGIYKVSNFGRIKSLGNNYNRKEKILKGTNNGSGYFMVTLSKHGKQKTDLVHRLVAIAFIQNSENKKCINHIDGNKANNCVNNLEWITYSENNIHAYLIGLKIGNRKGEKNFFAKLNESQIIKIREMYSTGNYSQKKISEIYNCTSTNICLIVNRNIWKHI